MEMSEVFFFLMTYYDFLPKLLFSSTEQLYLKFSDSLQMAFILAILYFINISLMSHKRIAKKHIVLCSQRKDTWNCIPELHSRQWSMSFWLCKPLGIRFSYWLSFTFKKRDRENDWECVCVCVCELCERDRKGHKEKENEWNSL